MTIAFFMLRRRPLEFADAGEASAKRGKRGTTMQFILPILDCKYQKGISRQI